jgi:hypothetical protein
MATKKQGKSTVVALAEQLAKLGRHVMTAVLGKGTAR